MKRIRALVKRISGARAATLLLWKGALALSCLCALPALALLYAVQSGDGDLYTLLRLSRALRELPAVFLLSSAFLTLLTERIPER